jgi:glycosyltransferase involved in cell wall biosynthesis
MTPTGEENGVPGLHVHMVCGEDPDSWILGKFAKNLVSELEHLGVRASLGRVPDPAADINHYVIFLDYRGESHGHATLPGHTTLMVTHVDDFKRLDRLRKGLETAAVAICMSRQTVAQLKAVGLPEDKLCYVNPAHDGAITPRPTVIGLATRLYDDGRKKEHWIEKLSAIIDPAAFSFRIMGEGWEPIVTALRRRGFDVDHDAAFDREKYRALMAAIDVYLYLGEDEGSMGYIDALAAGVATMVVPQGFHLDVEDGISYPVESFADLVDAFDALAEDKNKRARAVAEWTWEAYAKRHLAIWRAVVAAEPLPASSQATEPGTGATGVRWKFLRHTLGRRRRRLKRKLLRLKSRLMG